MKAFNEVAERQFSELVSSFSLTEKLAAWKGNHDEHSKIGILTRGLNLSPAFPAWWTSVCGRL